MMKKKNSSWIRRKDKIGWVYLLPFLLGFTFLFARPMVNSLIYSFNRITFDDSGMVMTPLGLENYRYALFGDANFFKTLLTFGGTVIVKIIVIMFLSMFLAVLLNQKFAGRLFFRTVLFLPVIFGADAIMEYFTSYNDYAPMTQLQQTSNQFMSMSGQTEGFLNEIISNFGFLTGLVELFVQYTDNLFTLTWEIGIQVVLFIIGLQSIPPYLYEVCQLEGATKWEEFWKITFPLMTPTILLCLIYTVVDSFNSSNEVMTLITGNSSLRIDYACAQAWLYTVLIFIIVLLINGVLSKRTVYLD